MNCCSGYDPNDEQVDDVQPYDYQENGPLSGFEIHLDSQNGTLGDVANLNYDVSEDNFNENLRVANIGAFGDVANLNHDVSEDNFNENLRDANNPIVIEDECDFIDETDDNSNETTLHSKKKAAVWTCINELRSGGAQCKFCDRTFRMQDKSTSNAIRHLQSVHYDEDLVKQMVHINRKQHASRKRKREEESKLKSHQPSIANIFPHKGPLDSKKQKNIVEAIVKYVIKANRPFQDVEHPDFRNLLFVANSSFVCPSRQTITRRFDDMALKVLADLKNEIKRDVTEAGHKTIHIVTDHGTSSDVFKTKKNVVVASRTTVNFEIKTDTVALIESKESQSGFRIRKDIKETLIETIGFDDTWTVCWKTDGAPNAVNARKPGAHESVGLEIHYEGTCVDHTLELCCNDALSIKDPNDVTRKRYLHPTFVNAIKKMKNLVNYLGESSLARQFFKQKMTDNDMNPLRTVKSTSNRFFSKYFEVDRFVEVRRAVDIFLDEYENLPDYLDSFDDNEWNVLKTYRDGLNIIVKASIVLEGRDYPTGSSVIPFLDSIHEEIQEFKNSLPVAERERKSFLKSLCDILMKNNRFGMDLYKTKSPYRELTLLDPRYGNLYFDSQGTQMGDAIDALERDKIFNEDRDPPSVETAARTPTEQQQNQVPPERLSVFERRRLQLLSRSDAGGIDDNGNTDQVTLKDKIKEEIKFLLKAMKKFESDQNVMTWYRENCSSVPLLAKFWRAYSSFPATSCGAERVFNVDGLIITDLRLDQLIKNSYHLLLTYF